MSAEQYIPIKLPSKGLAYKDVDMSKIKIRTFKAKDEQLIAELNIDNTELFKYYIIAHR